MSKTNTAWKKNGGNYYRMQDGILLTNAAMVDGSMQDADGDIVMEAAFADGELEPFLKEISDILGVQVTNAALEGVPSVESKLPTAKFNGIEMKVVFEEYNLGGTCIELYANSKDVAAMYETDDDEEFDDNEGHYEPFLCATSYIDGLKDGEVAIKDYSENRGVLEALIIAGIIAKPYRISASHQICKLLVEPVNPAI